MEVDMGAICGLKMVALPGDHDGVLRSAQPVRGTGGYPMPFILTADTEGCGMSRFWKGRRVGLWERLVAWGSGWRLRIMMAQISGMFQRTLAT